MMALLIFLVGFEVGLIVTVFLYHREKLKSAAGK